MQKKSLVLIISLVLLFNNIKSEEPNPPTWPNSVKIFEPSQNSAQNQDVLDKVFAEVGGSKLHGQFSSSRYALLFQPGNHNLDVNVGYYTQVMGLGVSPLDTQIKTVQSPNGYNNQAIGALDNFWRIAENFYTKPAQGVHMTWAVSQAAPLRRVYVDGDLNLFQSNGYASGGYMADMNVQGNVYAGQQQQFFARNSKMGSWQGSNWNQVFVGVEGGSQTNCGSYTQNYNKPETSNIAEKPFITFTNNKYQLFVPDYQQNKVGTNNNNQQGQSIDFSNVYVATETDSAQLINKKLESGLHLILTPGQYNLTDSIRVTRANTVVLGLGLATLISQEGNPSIVVSNVDGVRVSGILLQAGFKQTSTLLQWGQEDNYQGSSSAPGLLQDCYARVGGPTNPYIQQVQTNTMVVINSGNVILDNIWLWRADHGIAGETQDSQNPVQNGIIINGDNVTAYGLAVEHTLGDLTQWNGNNGKVYFYQSELPYDVTQENFGDKNYVGYRVNDNVQNHDAYGIGVYSYFANHDVIVDSAISVPNKSGVQVQNAVTVHLNGHGGIKHLVNDEGNSTISTGFSIQHLCQYPVNNDIKFLSY